MIIDVVSAFIASFAFGIIFNIKGKNLFFASFCGALGWFVYKISLKLGNSDTTSMFLASIALSTYSEIFARILKTPVTTFVVAALIPLVPGGGMYYTMYEAITGDIITSLEIGIKTLASAGVLSIGIILVSTITKAIVKYRRYYKI
ncbi:threonine/serine exporter family protein [Caproiciproducens sp. MSJ-32]|uniref:threonine/serine exporter family protein n=1 Tax=Caproiciproducens sp. MSJ-32 TaxID=2841527 RepID=UPI001C0F63B5|nr:threonine/serine exporter family protein [Caproiciproducens sp. MSJ-32]MBU5454825.1 threonine/serine exporter family protein [Caproiciproducens sp. MSJ-32]